MAHDWSGLLGAIEAHSVPRASSLIDEDEELRRRRASALRVEGQAPGIWFSASCMPATTSSWVVCSGISTMSAQ